MEDMTTGIDMADAAGSRTELLVFAGYNEFEKAADRTAIKIKEGFMEMGNILKIARDTDILVGSGYSNVEEFAQRRYDLDKGTVSRYIRIVERFSVGGNSHILKENYKKMGFAKLSLMLHMPDAIAEELMESLSKSEVLAIKEELDAESMISDIELAIEKAEEQETAGQSVGQGEQVQPPPEDAPLLQRAVYRLGKEQPAIYGKIWRAVRRSDLEIISDIIAPQGDAVHMVRIPGTGRVMIAIQGESASVTEVRTQAKERHDKGELVSELVKLCSGTWETWEDSYCSRYGELPEKEPAAAAVETGKSEVAPVQPAKEKRKESKVTKAKPSGKEPPVKEPPAAVVEAESTGSAEEEQIAGQDNIMNHPEYLPEEREETDDAGNGAGKGKSENPPHSVNTECGDDFTMTDKEWEDLWDEITGAAIFLKGFMTVTPPEKVVQNRIPKGTLEENYKTALDLAAGLEKVINGKKYFT
ncbi:MAG: hypothetical protein NC092_04570 [Butyrivibrio sp.]|nr:hypothetical protein [Muribaculum sp.]MCM1551948.1 hypothetical protein [Butyrivibrio sp.]